ncbi:MAG: PQQ-dependent sugar dehydrogenase [Candidatus Binatia bacterium]
MSRWIWLAAAVAFFAPRPLAALTLPANFQSTTALSGLSLPTAVAFATDGRVFVAEKSGLIKVFDSLTDTTPEVFADLRTNVHNFWDRGLLGLALHPDFPATPYVYVLYTYDAVPGGSAPRWGTAGASSDGCPSPPGPTTGGCPVTGRLSRLEAAGGGNTWTGVETPLLTDWCQQFPSHSVATVTFGPDGMLYVSAGDGASFTQVDYGQLGSPPACSGPNCTPVNVCNDPPSTPGASPPIVPTTADAEGGSLRAQDLQTLGTPATDPVGYNGSVLRVDPITGAAAPGNPLAGSSTPGADRIIAYGLRNPFRMTLRPGTNEVWIGDVGWGTWEEIDRITSPTAGVLNFGWPCYEGAAQNGGFPAVPICANLWANPSATTAPVYAYRHDQRIAAGEVSCTTGSSAIAGLAFYSGAEYPAPYQGALFFTDYNRRCIWAMLPGAGGEPDANNRVVFADGLSGGAVQLEAGPNGDLFWVNFDLGRIERIRYVDTNHAPTAVVQASPTSGVAPLHVQFDGSASSDPDAGDTITFAWDLDGDGQYNDSTAVSPTADYSTPGTYTVGLRVTDNHGKFGTASIVITAGNTAPAVTITAPASTLTWHVGETIAFSATATDGQDGTLPASAFTWRLIVDHCPSNCHQHIIEDFPGIDAGTFIAPDHDYPSALTLEVTVTDSGGLTDSASVQILPETVDLTFASVPAGLVVVVGPVTAATPFVRTVIVGSGNTVTAPSPQSDGTQVVVFGSWSDGGTQTHEVIAPAAPATFTATFVTAPSCGNGTVDPGEQCDDGNSTAGDCCSPACQFETAGTVCRAAAGACDLAETCSGTSGTCPTDAKRSDVCRPAAGACDVPESCDGTHDDCPADGLVPADTVCRPAAGPCDAGETCTGSSAACPTDTKRSDVCRPAAGACDLPESCDGTHDDCPADGLVPADTVCRPAAGPCDAGETCTGSSAACPADTKRSGVCRPPPVPATSPSPATAPTTTAPPTPEHGRLSTRQHRLRPRGDVRRRARRLPRRHRRARRRPRRPLQRRRPVHGRAARARAEAHPQPAPRPGGQPEAPLERGRHRDRSHRSDRPRRTAPRRGCRGPPGPGRHPPRRPLRRSHTDRMAYGLEWVPLPPPRGDPGDHEALAPRPRWRTRLAATRRPGQERELPGDRQPATAPGHARARPAHGPDGPLRGGGFRRPAGAAGMCHGRERERRAMSVRSAKRR